MDQEISKETIIRQHRHWTRWLATRRTLDEGNLVLTNRRLLFLHRIESSPDVTESIRRLADAPIETVLDHALTLHKNCFQIHLQDITRVGIGVFMRFLSPSFYLSVTYRKGKKQTLYIADFQFLRPKTKISFIPQIIQDFFWMNAIKQAKRKSASLETG